MSEDTTERETLPRPTGDPIRRHGRPLRMTTCITPDDCARYETHTSACELATGQCRLCPHPFHGLQCEGRVYRYPDQPYLTGPCPCRGPFAEEPA